MGLRFLFNYELCAVFPLIVHADGFLRWLSTKTQQLGASQAGCQYCHHGCLAGLLPYRVAITHLSSVV